MTKYYQQNKKCYACGRHRTSRYLGYDPRTMKSYCIDPRMCPAASKIPEVELIPFDRDVMIRMLSEHYDGPVLEALDKLLGKTHSFRPTPAQTMHILKIAQTYNLTSLNSTILHILEQHMEEHPMDHVELNEINWSLDHKGFTTQRERKRPQPRRTPEVEAAPEPEPESQQLEEEEEFDNDIWTV